jgi:hypothetical protein
MNALIDWVNQNRKRLRTIQSQSQSRQRLVKACVTDLSAFQIIDRSFSDPGIATDVCRASARWNNSIPQLLHVSANGDDVNPSLLVCVEICAAGILGLCKSCEVPRLQHNMQDRAQSLMLQTTSDSQELPTVRHVIIEQRKAGTVQPNEVPEVEA